ncbi:MAG: biopolymer transporter ExbD [Verrucomicrobiaceae bacterium]|nr:MAG: biopolymer transporter ExbD [Verrucomicrobiaceae bacterium]
MASGGGSIESGEPEFQIAPMVDVLLVLLVFFVSISSAQVELVDERVKVPVAPDSMERKPDPNQALLNVIWKENEQKAVLNYAGRDYEGDFEPLVALLQAKAEGNDKFEVIIRGDKNTPAREMSAAIAVVSQATAKVSFATVNKSK